MRARRMRCIAAMRLRLPVPAVRTASIVLALTTMATLPARADEPPALRQGLWQFERTVAGQKLQTQECVNPNEEMQREHALLETGGCASSPGHRADKTYTFSADRTIKPPGGQPVTVRSTSVMTVEDDSAYKVEITTTGAGTATQELLLARRLGECTK